MHKRKRLLGIIAALPVLALLITPLTASAAPVSPQATCNWLQLLLGCKEPVTTPPTPPVVTPPVVTPPVTEPTDTDCGVTTYKANGTKWNCTFADNFTGKTLDRTKWVPQEDFVSGNKNFYACYIDNPAVVSQSNGTLKLSVRKMDHKVDCPKNFANNYYAAGQISTFYKFSQQYGKFEARVKSPVINKTSLQEAFWLWPDVRESSTANWPFSGEIDITETYSEHPNLAIPYLHYNAQAPKAGLNTSYSCLANRGEWNTYAVEWDANKVEIFVNGKSCLINTSKSGAFKKKYIIAMTAALGVPANSYADLNKGPQTTEVDYIRAWK